MHSVPGDALDVLREAALRTGMINTDTVLDCLLRHGDTIQAEHADGEELTALQRRVRARARRDRARAGQLTFLKPHERAEVDAMASASGMSRSRLVTEALDRGLADVG